ncbi:MAG: PLP-dependent aminotransferase family protein [Lachnospiraceae bacterium]|nr:PLP-dependent aminotransferase family protein [Lachnospiraceae bacterium]
MNELAITLKAGTGEYLYLQIYEYIKKEIRTGKLRRNERLPSTRSLAEYLQVARSTVDLAYSQLLAEGYIESKPYKGYFVCNMEELFDLEKQAVMHAVKKTERVSAVQTSVEKTTTKFDFSPHAISMKEFPFATWKKITKEILIDANSEMFALGDARGDYELRETIGRYLHAARGVNCDPEQIIIGAGNDYLLMLLEKILGADVCVAMENPTYRRAYQVFKSFGYRIDLLPMDENGIQMEALYQSGAKVAYVMPSHQYPTGVVMPIRRRMELLKWAEAEEGRYLIEDDYDSEFRYKGKPVPALQASDQSGKVIYLGTFSKSIAPAIRVGYLVLPKMLLEKYRENCGFYASTVSRIDQRILNEFIKDGYFERYLNKMRKAYKEKHDYLLEQLTCFERTFDFSGENAGLHILLTAKKEIPAKELITAAEEEGIKIYGVSDSLLGNVNEKYLHTVMLGYGALEKDEIKEGIDKLKLAWKNYI